MFESIIAAISGAIFDKLWVLVEAKLNSYFEAKSKISAISTEAGQLQEELKNATTDAERIQILRKIGDFSERLGT